MIRRRHLINACSTILAAILGLSLAAAMPGCSRPAPSPRRAATRAAVQPKADSLTADLFPIGSCTVTVTGALQLSFSAPSSPSAFHTDYWWSEAWTRSVLAAEAADDRDVAEKDEAWYVDQRATQDPVYTPMLISCVTPEGTVTIAPGRGSQYADVPFAPRDYEISPGMGPEDAIRGHFAATVIVNKADGKSEKFAVSKPGVLTVSEFDHARIAGTFSFAAIGAGKKAITVQGRFAYQRPATR